MKHSFSTLPAPSAAVLRARPPGSYAIPVHTFTGRSLLGDPRLDRAASGSSPLWNRSLLDRLQTPLTRYHD